MVCTHFNLYQYFFKLMYLTTGRTDGHILYSFSFNIRHNSHPHFTLTINSSHILTGSQGANLKSSDTVPKSLDKAMDKAIPSSNHVEPGISLRNGPVDEEDVDAPTHNGSTSNGIVNGHVNGKRKSRQSMSNGQTYKEASSENDEDDKPLVRLK